MTTKKMLPLPYPFSLEEELKKNPEIKMSDIELLREWCDKQQHLPKVTDLHLILFLHSNYYSMEAAKNTAESFFTIRSHVPEFFSIRDPLGSKELRQALNVAAITGLSGLSKQGHKVLFGKLVDPDPSHYSFEDVTKSFFMVSDLVGLKTGTCEGYIFIGDSANVSLGHVGRISPMGMKKLVMYVQEAIPVRLKGIHFINTPPVMDVIMNMAKPFMKKELWNMMHLHSSLKTLEEFVSLDILPNEVGGKAGSISKIQEDQIKEIDSKREWFIEEEKLSVVDEALRIGKSKTANDLFGVEGTFKKLEID
ncbi:alpha-tocopherol transfer protein-like [Ptiloglossa arizonensis]|uniref:alpha-tocopherol transfer protein-like n=1 Tax=Ptiloglossa arizonensis TaxID=3350558 RepID=UPI003F9F74BC